MAPINKKFRAVDALKHSIPSSNSSYSPPSSPSVSSPPSVIVRNECQRTEAPSSCSSDSEQIDLQISRRASHNDPMADQQDLPIDATIGAKIDEHFETNLDSRAPSTGDSTSNESIEMLNNSEERAASFANSSLLGFNAHSLPPSPSSVITENTSNHQKDSSSSGPGYCDSNKIRTRADNSNSEPFPYESRLRNFSPISKHSTKSPPTLIPSEPHSHRHVSFRVDNNVSPTPSKSSTTSESHKSSSSSSGSKGSVDKNSEEYRLRRERNNIAVRKSRSKSKVKFIQTIDRMNQLEEENNKLHAKIEEMTRLVSYLQVMLSKYRLEDPRRFEHLEHLMAIEMSQYPVLI